MIAKVLPHVAFCMLLAGLPGLSSAAQTAPAIGRSLDAWVTRAESQIVPAAEAMPEDRYSFAPTAGEFRGVRTFAEQVKHLAANNYRVAALLRHQTPTSDQSSETGSDSARTKAEIVGYLKGSFAALHRAVTPIDAANATEPITKSEDRLALAVDAVAHSFDHYGQIVEYLRMNGIVPPASR